jgi:hypothetical protein
MANTPCDRADRSCRCAPLGARLANRAPSIRTRAGLTSLELSRPRRYAASRLNRRRSRFPLQLARSGRAVRGARAVFPKAAACPASDFARDAALVAPAARREDVSREASEDCEGQRGPSGEGNPGWARLKR